MGAARMVYRDRYVSGMYWIAFVGIGALFVGIFLAEVLDVVHGALPDPRALMWGPVMYVLVKTGRTTAFRLRIVEDALEWSAPLRRRRVPLHELAAAEVDGEAAGARLVGGLARFTTTSGDALSVVVRERSERRFSEFCEAVELRAPNFAPPTAP